MSKSLLTGPSLLQLHFELLVECCGQTEETRLVCPGQTPTLVVLSVEVHIHMLPGR